MDRRVQKTRAAIRNAYFSLLLKKKTSAITITEIARTANIDRKTFYLHYASVDDIYKEFCKEKVDIFLTSLEKEDFFRHPFDMKKMFHVLNKLIEPDISFYKRIAEDHIYDFFWAQIRNVMISTIQEVYASKVNLSPDKLEVHAQFYASGFISVYKNWLKNESSLSIDELGEIAGEASYYGIQKMLELYSTDDKNS